MINPLQNLKQNASSRYLMGSKYLYKLKVWKEECALKNFKQTSQGKFPYPSITNKNGEVMIELKDIGTQYVMDLSIFETWEGLQGNDKLFV